MPVRGLRPLSGQSALKVRRAFAHAKMHWAKMDAEKLVTEGPPKGKEHRHPEQYYDNVIKGAHLVVDECTKDVIFE